MQFNDSVQFQIGYEKLAVVGVAFLKPRPHVSWYFLISFPDSKIFPSTVRSIFRSNSPVHTHPTVSGFTIEKLGPHVVSPYWFFCSVRDWTRFCYVIGLENIRIRRPLLSDSIYLFPLWRAIQKYPDSLPKPYPERKRCRFKNTLIRVDGTLSSPALDIWPTSYLSVVTNK